MKLTTQKESAALKANDLYWESYLKGDIEKLSTFLVENYSQIGSVEEEVFFNKKDALKFVFDTIDQIAGKVEMRNRNTTHGLLGDFILIYELCDLYVLVENEWTFYSRFRATSLFQEKPDGWKIIHQHSSLPDSKAQEGDNIAIEKVSKENLQLRDAIKRRTIELENKNRELEIEAALEKVRSKSLAMHRSEELQEVVNTVFDRLKELNIQTDSINLDVFNVSKKDAYLWTAVSGHSYQKAIHIPYTESAIFKDIYDGMISGKLMHSKVYSRELKDEFLNYLFEHTYFREIPQERKDFLYSSDATTVSVAYTKNTAIIAQRYSNNPFSDDENEILKRFAKVFEQSYTRFLDLQKAEAQAREAQIEAALERVRSRTMAMHNSKELQDAALLLFKQVQSLGIPVFTCGYNIWEIGENVCTGWMSSEGMVQSPFKIPLTESPTFIRFLESKEKGVDFYVEEVGGDTLADHYKYMLSLPGFNAIAENFLRAGFSFPSFQINHIVNFKYGNLIFISYEAVPDAYEIFKRFGKVFEQTYTRFLDLKKAEAQTREAQIEGALEKIRSRSLAMHHSREIPEVIATMFEKLRELKAVHNTVAIQFFDFKTRDSVFWVGNNLQQVAPKILLPFDQKMMEADTCHRDLWNAMEKGEVIFNKVYTKQQKDQWFEYVFAHNDSTVLEEQQREFIRKAEIHTVCFIPMKNAGLFASSWDGPKYSEENFMVLSRVAKVFDQAYTRFLDLQKAEMQAREAEIELALERVRNRAMAMHSSQELKDVATELRNQMSTLGQTDMEICAIHLYDESPDYFESIAAGPVFDPTLKVIQVQVKLPKHGIQIIEEMMNQYYSGKKDYVLVNHGAKGVEWFELLKEKVPLAYEFVIQNLKGNPLEELIYHWSVSDFKGGSLVMTTYVPPSDEARKILRRFANVFGLAYQRFKDLQNAEAQAREAQIEAALERVRARTMAMHNSEDVTSATATMFDELKKLGFENLRCGIANIHHNRTFDVFGVTNLADGIKMSGFGFFGMDEHPIWQRWFESWKNKEEVFIAYIAGQEKEEYFNNINNHHKYLPQKIAQFPDTFFQAYYFEQGSVWAYSLFQHTEPEKEIMKRFATGFSLTFRRYQDLKKAESQAREAQIENALEKVRSRTMAMQHSDELAEAAFVLFQQLQILGIVHERINIGIVKEESQTIDFWITEQGGNQINTRFTGRIDEPTTLSKMYLGWKKNQKSMVLEQIGENLANWLKYLKEEIGIPFDPAFLHHRRVQTVGFFSKGMLVVTTPEPLPDENLQLLERFAGVFDLTYTRFSDLKYAEAQAREAQVEVALERIRARALAMQSSTELSDVANVLREQMGILGQEDLESSVVHLYSANSPTFDSWYAFRAGDKIIEGQTTFRLENSGLAKEFVKLYFDEISEYTIEVKGELLNEWLAEIKRNAPEIAAHWGDLPPEKQFYHFSDFSGGALLMVSHQTLSAETRMLQKRCALVFELAYKRFLDLEAKESQDKALREEKQRLEKALTELKDTQSQLIQSEKMASLGQLTAGIAHEIQNPLNFVNNFSEVSNELIEEIEEEREKSQESRDEILIGEILADVKENLGKITLHGKRADAIVKGMLEHSRTSSGEKVPTDLNALADEYLKLSYHGMRAKDKSFSAEFETNFDPTLPKINVVPQEIGRVLLNIINNAFYASRNQSLEGEKSMVTVSTSAPHGGQRIEIRISDNGPGIPDAIKDKIFQPFFTTKPTGEGTGLGLSLSYDIVKSHGGEIRVESKEGEGSLFSILIPINN